MRKGGKGGYVDALTLDVAATTTPPPPPPGPPVPTVGQVIITEVMADPVQVTDTVGECFELENVSSGEVSLSGCTVTNQSASSVTLPAAIVAPGVIYVLARSTDSSSNGGVPTNAPFAFALPNSGSLTLACASTTIDSVVWTSATAGKSRSLDPDFYRAAGNDVDGNWCLGSQAYGLGDLGTPAALNPQCP